MLEVIWDNPHAYNPSSELLIDLASLLFLNQQVSTHTRKSNVLDLIVCSDELISRSHTLMTSTHKLHGYTYTLMAPQQTRYKMVVLEV